MKHAMQLSGIALLLALSMAAHAATDSKAVSASNGKMELFGGRIDGEGSINLSGSYSFPLSTYLGVQFDGLYGQLDGRGVYGAGGHFFWRNSDYALLGLTGSYLQHRSADLWRIGGEGELYWNQITLAGQLGNQSGDLGSDGYGRIDARYYLAEDYLMLSAGAGHFDNRTVWGGDAEYLTDLGGLSLFASGGRGGDGFYYALGGIRYYFGAKKSLLRRHREDDPFNPLFSFMSDSIDPIKRAPPPASF